MAQVTLEREGKVAVVKLSRGVTNAIGGQLVEELAAATREVRQDPEALAMVLTSEGDRFLSIGLDIPELIGLDREAFTGFIRAYDRACVDIYSLAKPTVAAVRGHATAGGCILALCCDHRVIASGRKVMGLNEVKLGVTLPYPADRMLRDLVDGRTASHVAEVGEFYGPEELLAMGLVDDVVPPDRVVPAALELAGALAASPPGAYAAIKAIRTGPVLDAIEEELAQRQAEFVDLWFSERARENLEAAMERF